MPDRYPVIDTHNHLIPEPLFRASSGTAPLELLYAGGRPVGVGAGGRQLGPINEGLLELSVQMEDMHRKGLDLRGISLPPYLAQYELPPEQGAAWSRRANEALAHTAAGSGGKLIPIATVPLQAPKLAARTLEHATRELGVRAVQITTHVNGVELDDSQFLPFWESAAALGTTVIIHPTTVRGSHFGGEFFLRNLVGNPTETTVAGARILFSGLLERCPGLRICLVHGGGTLPYLVGRLAHGFACRAECQIGTQRSPLEMLSQFYFDTVVFNPAVLRALVGIVGVDRVVLGTDHPYDMGEDDPVGLVQRAELGRDGEQAILSATPSAMFGLSAEGGRMAAM